MNTELPGGPIEHKGSKTGVLLIHGFTATTSEVRILAKSFIKHGCTVSAPLLPGHGTSPEDLNLTKVNNWIKCIEDSYTKLKEKCDSIIVGGESMGGVLSLYMAENNPEISAILLYSTALSVKRLKYSKILKYFHPFLDKNSPSDGLSWKGYSVYPLWAAHQFYKLTRLVKRKLSLVKSPTIIFQGNYDKTIDANNLQLIFDNIGSEKKKKIWMKNSGHVMLLDQEIDKIILLTHKFLKDLNILS
jgi:carboxylesterase